MADASAAPPAAARPRRRRPPTPAEALFTTCDGVGKYSAETLPLVQRLVERIRAAVDARRRAASGAARSAGATSDADVAAMPNADTVVAAAVMQPNTAAGGLSPLHLAAYKDTQIGAPVLCFLLSCIPEGSSVDVFRDGGATPLHDACKALKKDPDGTGVKALLARGADLDALATPTPGEVRVLPGQVAALQACERKIPPRITVHLPFGMCLHGTVTRAAAWSSVSLLPACALTTPGAPAASATTLASYPARTPPIRLQTHAHNTCCDDITSRSSVPLRHERWPRRALTVPR